MIELEAGYKARPEIRHQIDNLSVICIDVNMYVHVSSLFTVILIGLVSRSGSRANGTGIDRSYSMTMYSIVQHS